MGLMGDPQFIVEKFDCGFKNLRIEINVFIIAREIYHFLHLQTHREFLNPC
tara:strand:+ start:323 stop:475 length:153 start_codon:yes stop_codon:yes gene_type:complete